MYILYDMTPVPTAIELTAKWQSSNVYLSNGTLLGTFDTVNGVEVDRTLLQENQIPQVMSNAMMAAEDRNFMTEGGISLTGLVRSAYEDAFGHGGLQGGSTITMQYAKNYYTGVDTGQNMSTKIKEVFIAMKLAHQESKQWIMTQYLNTVPFGPTIDGVGAAALNYFDVNLAQGGTLTYEQAAELAAMPNNPSVLSPNPSDKLGYQLLQGRWKYVLTNMLRDGNITQQQFSAAKFPAYNPPKTAGATGVNGYLMQMVEQQLMAPKSDGGLGLTTQQIATGGYHIVTTFSMRQIKALAASVNEEKAIIKEQGGASLPDYDHIGAALIDPKTGAITAIYGGPGYLSNQAQCLKVNCDINNAEVPEEVGSSFKPYVLATAVNEGMNVFNSILDGYGHIYIPTSPADSKTTELALSVLSPPAGATIGSTGFFQPTDPTFYYHFPEGADDAAVDKPLPVSVAAATSSDPAFEDLAHRDGITNVIDMAQTMGVGTNAFLYPSGCTAKTETYAQTLAACNDFNGQNGIQSQFSPDPSLASKYFRQQGLPGSPQIALGEAPLTAIEQASTFATLADDGVYHQPHVIAQISQSGTPVTVPVTIKRVMSTAGAADVSWALSFDNLSAGTAFGDVTYRPGGIIAKTGTIGSGADSSQAWFVGAVPEQESMAVALYTNLPGKQNLDNLPNTPSGMQGSLGGAWPASIWNNYFTTNDQSASYSPVASQMPIGQAGFQQWIQAKAQPKKPKICRPGQFKNCTCPPGRAAFCSGNPNPNPSKSCGPFGNGRGCNTPGPSQTPNPSPSCGGFGNPCQSSTGPSPSPDPSSGSPSPDCSPNPALCSSSPTAGAGQGLTPDASASPFTTAAEDTAAVISGALGVIISAAV
jgi:membrane peptidoglycan carboxypeptidase